MQGCSCAAVQNYDMRYRELMIFIQLEENKVQPVPSPAAPRFHVHQKYQLESGTPALFQSLKTLGADVMQRWRSLQQKLILTLAVTGNIAPAH